ncbi:MAG: hypothetical protein MJ053_04735 [Elusimicrobiaceae bacterium]|nr:hypothetical protein [Elusimicrobiaceae bacterium]
MGGAGVATAYGPDAQYWNPAALAQQEDVNEAGLLLNAGADMQVTKHVLEGIRNLTDMSHQYKALQTAINNNQPGSNESLSTIFEELNDIAKIIGNNMGALVNADAGVGFKIKNFAVSGRALGTGSILPVVDTRNINFNNGAGLMIGDPSASLSPTNQSAADALAAAIDANGVIMEHKNLLNATSCSNSSQLAVALIDAALSLGATEAQIAHAVGVATSNMEGASTILRLYTDADPATTYKDNETLAMADAGFSSFLPRF